MQTSAGQVILISVYATELVSSYDTKDKFYEELNATVGEVPHQE